MKDTRLRHQGEFDELEIWIRGVVDTDTGVRLIHHDVELVLRNSETDFARTQATALIWRAQVDKTSLWTVFDAIGGGDEKVFAELDMTHARRLGMCLDAVDDVVYLMKFRTQKATAAPAMVPFLDTALAVIGRGCTAALAAAPATPDEAAVLSAIGFAPLTFGMWAR